MPKINQNEGFFYLLQPSKSLFLFWNTNELLRFKLTLSHHPKITFYFEKVIIGERSFNESFYFSLKVNFEIAEE